MYEICPTCGQKIQKPQVVEKAKSSIRGDSITIPSVNSLIHSQVFVMSSIDPDLTVHEQLLTTLIKIVKEVKDKIRS